MAKPALGRGLGALLSGAPQAPKQEGASPAPAQGLGAPPTPKEQVQKIPVARIRPSPLQPRKDFTDESLRELADSIREQGIIQPLIVRDQKDFFELIAGERRWRAAQLAGLAEVPVLVREADDRTLLEMALIENLQRENLNPMEEALGYAQLIEQFQLKQEQAAEKVGKSRAAVANSLRLLKLPEKVQLLLKNGRLSVGHAKVILGLAADQQTSAADRIIAEGLNVRQTEELVARWQSQAPSPAKTVPVPPPTRDAHVQDLENKLKQRLSTKVSVRYRKGKGSIEIRFFSDDELERLLQILGLEPD